MTASRTVYPADRTDERRPPARPPLVAFSVTVIGLTWAVQLSFLALGWPLFPALVVELGILLSTATLLTHRLEGRAGVRRLYAAALRWRFGAPWYALILVLLPATTLAVAATSGTLAGPSDGWGTEVFQYLFLTLVFGALLGNVWEELAWTGFVQERLGARHGLLEGALLTAVPFGLIHLPLAFEQDGLTGTSPTDLALSWTLLLGVAPFFRYLIGLVHARTGRSVLAVAILHGSFNACASTSLTTGGWEYIAAVIAATIVVAIVCRLSRRGRGGRLWSRHSAAFDPYPREPTAARLDS